MENKPLVNRVAASGLITINLEDFYPTDDIVVFDIKDYLFRELILKEKDFRKALKEIDWSDYSEKILLISCSANAIIPLWAYMLITAYASPFARDIFQGTETEYIKKFFSEAIQKIDVKKYENQLLIIKGCSKKTVPPSGYVELTKKLQPIARSIMFGEPCSTVPIYKKRKLAD